MRRDAIGAGILRRYGRCLLLVYALPCMPDLCHGSAGRCSSIGPASRRSSWCWSPTSGSISVGRHAQLCRIGERRSGADAHSCASRSSLYRMGGAVIAQLKAPVTVPQPGMARRAASRRGPHIHGQQVSMPSPESRAARKRCRERVSLHRPCWRRRRGVGTATASEHQPGGACPQITPAASPSKPNMLLTTASSSSFIFRDVALPAATLRPPAACRSMLPQVGCRKTLWLSLAVGHRFQKRPIVRCDTGPGCAASDPKQAARCVRASSSDLRVNGMLSQATPLPDLVAGDARPVERD